MSVLEELHQAHKDRIARIDAAAMPSNPQQAQPVLLLSRIVATVALYFDISRVDLLSERRTAGIVLPRQIGMYLCRKLTTRSLPEIGRAFGGKDHTTVLHSFHKIEELIKTRADIATQVDELTAIIQDEQSGGDWRALESEINHVCKTAWLTAKELEGYRRHPGARRFLTKPEVLDDLEKARDYLSRALDDMRGVK